MVCLENSHLLKFFCSENRIDHFAQCLYDPRIRAIPRLATVEFALEIDHTRFRSARNRGVLFHQRNPRINRQHPPLLDTTSKTEVIVDRPSETGEPIYGLTVP